MKFNYKIIAFLLSFIILIIPINIDTGLLSSAKKFIKNPKSYIGNKLFGGAVEGAMSPSIDKLGVILNGSINNLNKDMEKRVAQMSDSIKMNINLFDANLNERLKQADKILENRI